MVGPRCLDRKAAMRLWHILRSRLRSILFRDRREHDLSEELQLHVEREIERRVAEGVPEHEARHQALRMFGSVESLKEECRDARGTAARRSPSARHAARRPAPAPRLALHCRCRPHPRASGSAPTPPSSASSTPRSFAADRSPIRTASSRSIRTLLKVDRASTPTRPISTWRRTPACLRRSTAASVPNGATYLDRGAVRSWQSSSTPRRRTWPCSDCSRQLGRWFDAAEDRPGTDIVAVIGHQAWTTRFGGDPSVIGRTIRMQGRAGHDRRRRTGGPQRDAQHRPRHRLLAADFGGAGAGWTPAGFGTASHRGRFLREGSSQGRRHRRASAVRDGQPRATAGEGVSERGSRQGHLCRSPRPTCVSIRRWICC